jgi:hypothetical protein
MAPSPELDINLEDDPMKSFLKELVVHILVGCLACQSIYAQAPQWWNDAGLISENLPADDFAPLNAGQLKFMAWKATQQMNSRLTGGAGGALNQMVESWLAPENFSSADDYSAATLGQLKAVAAPIYQRLSEAGLAVSAPWTETADDDDDQAVANTGQAKRVFSFELPEDPSSPMAADDGPPDPLLQAGATVAASPPPTMAAPALTLDTTIQHPGVYYYGNESYGNAQAIGYYALPQDTTHRYYAGARAKHEFKIPSWTHNKSLTHETRDTKGSKPGSYYKINTTSVETGTHVETYNVDWSGTCTNPIVTTTEAEQANGVYSPQFFQQRGTWREKLVCSVKQVHTSRHEYKGVTDSSTWSNLRAPIYPDNIEYWRARGDELRTYVTTVENKINHEASGVADYATIGVTEAGMNFNWPNSDKIQAKRTEDLTYRYNWQWKIPGPRGTQVYHPKVPLKSPAYPKDSKKNLVDMSGQSAYPVKSDKGTTEPTKAPARDGCTYLKLSSDGPTVQRTGTQEKLTYDVVHGTDRKKVPGASHEITLNRENPVLPSAVKQEFMSYLAGKAWQGWVRDTDNNAPTVSHYSMVDKAPNNAGYYAHSGTKLAWALAYQVPSSYTSAQRDALRPASTTVTYYHYSSEGNFLNSASRSFLLFPGDTLSPTLVNASQTLAEGGVIAVTTQTSLLPVELDVAKISHNTASGELDDSKKESTGAFLPLNSDDDDYSATSTSLGSDKDQTGAITGENDLIPIYLKKLPQLTGAKFLLDIPSKVKVWKNSNRQDEATATTEFDASVDTTVYAEGVSKGSDLLKLTLRHGGQDKTNIARLKLTVFELKGVLNVPGYTAYSYTADGSLPTGSKWGTPTSGTVKSGSTATQATILWDQGPVVGKAVYELSSDYVWDLEVNVVQVKIKQTGNTATYNSAPFQKGGLLSALIASNSWTNAMTANVVVDTVEGPTINGAQRGKKFMELGIVHQAGFDAKHGLYDDSFFLFPNKRKRSSLQDGQTHWDAAKASTLPWTLKDADHHLDITSDSASISNQVFKTFDQPELLGTYPFTLSGDQVDRLAINMFHILYFAVRTKQNVNNSYDSLTQRCKLNWRFDGSGSVDASGKWTLTGSGVTGDPTFSEVTNGDTIPNAAANINEAFNTETWTTENQ